MIFSILPAFLGYPPSTVYGPAARRTALSTVQAGKQVVEKPLEFAHVTAYIEDQTVLVRVKWAGHNDRHQITLPNGMWPATDKPNAVRIVPLSRASALLFVTCSTESGVYDIKAIEGYKLSSNGIQHLKANSKMEFSDAGSWAWHPREKHLLVWDAVLDANAAHHAASKYRVSAYMLRKGGWTESWSRVTRRSYLVPWTEDGKRPLVVPKSSDPLRELGLRWSWWWAK